MTDTQPPELTREQISVLERLLRAGFRLVSLERVARQLVVEKGGFVAMLDPAAGKLSVFGQVGYRMGDGLGMLVERAGRKVFVWHSETVAATPELLDAYERFKAELKAVLEPESSKQKAVGRMQGPKNNP